MNRIVQIVLLGLIQIGFVACDEEILHDLDELQANSVRVALAKAGIEAWKEQRGSSWSVGVSSPDVTTALSLLDSKRVIRRPRHAPSSSSLIQSREERTYFVERTLSTGLEQTLERIPGMLEARVHIKLAEKPSYSQSKKKRGGSASVLLIQSTSVDTDLQAVKELVAGASGLSEASIAVVTVVENPKLEPTSPEPAEQNTQPTFKEKITTSIRSHRSIILSFALVLFLGVGAHLVLRALKKTQERLRGTESEGSAGE